jgi:hypothetical protein
MKTPKGNGSGKFQINVTDKGGWIVIYPAQPHSLPTDLPVHLSRTMEQWFIERPHLRIRSAVPIVQDGNTIIIHAFYDQVLWPQPAPPTPSP